VIDFYVAGVEEGRPPIRTNHPEGLASPDTVRSKTPFGATSNDARYAQVRNLETIFIRTTRKPCPRDSSFTDAEPGKKGKQHFSNAMPLAVPQAQFTTTVQAFADQNKRGEEKKKRREKRGPRRYVNSVMKEGERRRENLRGILNSATSGYLYFILEMEVSQRQPRPVPPPVTVRVGIQLLQTHPQ